MKKMNCFTSKRGIVSAFTLAEMMVVMLILSVILAAMAPVMTTRYKSKPNDSSPWKYEANNRLNAYFGGPNSIAMIGQNEFQSTDDRGKLLIKLDNADTDYNFLAFKRGDNKLGRLYINNDGGLMFGSTTGRLGTNANSVGRMSEASGTNATAFGSAAKANKDAATAVGSSVTASGVSSLAVGTSSNATADNSIAIGTSTTASGSSAIAIGNTVTASGQESTALGEHSRALTAGTTALGRYAYADQDYATAVGAGATALLEATAFGSGAEAKSNDSVAVGYLAKVSENSTGAIAIGQGAKAKAERAIAIGQGSKIENLDESNLSTGSIAIGATNGDVTGEGSIAIGDNVQARGSIYKDGYASVVSIGKNASAVGYHAIAIGENAKAQGGSNKYSSSNWGNENFNWSFASIAIGANADASTPYSNGTTVKSKTINTIALGDNAKANAANAIAIGMSANADTNSSGSIAIGTYASASTPDDRIGMGYSIALGTNSKATGAYSIAIGSDMGGTTSHSGDAWTEAKGKYSIAIGNKAKTEDLTEGSGYYASTYSGAIAIGKGARAKGNSVAIGQSANAWTKKQIVLGTADYTVYIPGRLIVGLNSFFGANVTGSDQAVGGHWGNGGVRDWIRDYNKGFDVANAKPAPGQGYDEVYKFMTTSDRRLKYVGKENKSGLDKIRQLKVFNYTFKKDAKKEPHVGIIAQDLQKVFPNAVKKGADGFLTIRMEDMFYAVINAIKELDAKYQAQEKRINELEKRIEKLEAKGK